MKMKTLLVLGTLVAVAATIGATTTLRAGSQGNPAAGRRTLLDTPLAVGPGFGTIAESEWDDLWLVFPKALKNRIKRNPELKQKLTLERYGLFTEPSVHSKRPIGFSINPGKKNKWEMTCLVCHGGRIPSPTGPQFLLGAPANTFDITTFVSDRIELSHKHPFKSKFTIEERVLVAAYEKVIDSNPTNQSRGTYNVWTSGDAFLALRKPDMSIDYVGYIKALTGHAPTFGNRASDMDPPAWWNTKYKDRLFIDGFVPKEPRMLSIIIMAKDNPVVEWDQQGLFADVLAYINSVPAPKNLFTIDHVRAARGKQTFENTCYKCHGTYADDGVGVEYPAKTIPIDKLKTDSGRLITGMTPEYRQFVKDSWVGDYGKADVRTRPEGYMPPPLRGVWASAPYLHNGSVPTLYHVLFPQERPAIWKAERHTLDQSYDPELGGFRFETATPTELSQITDKDIKREYFDTRLKDKSNQGHTFPEALTREERLDVLEYLKTL